MQSGKWSNSEILYSLSPIFGREINVAETGFAKSRRPLLSSPMSEQGRIEELESALSRIPAGLFIVTAAFEGVQVGVMVQWVQRVMLTPPLLSVVIPKGVRITPLIRDSRAFAVSALNSQNRYLTRRFKSGHFEDESIEGVGIETAVTGSPLLTRAVACFDCELVRQLDIEPDADLYVGEIKAVRINRPDAKTLVFLGEERHEI